ncbi:glycosyltransferase [candidate division CSSED10-310 bacterium]|uniref:Glycosyltransferase n=1 Tax=candidate division CSSED10-310 bacterium TaxID=2855610 RepID=A0ABV6YUB9_UNCC1
MKNNLKARPWPLNIFMIAPEPFFTPRGTPLSEFYRIQALTELGHRVDLVTYHLGQDVDIPGLTIHRIASIPLIKRIAIGPSAAKIILDFFLFFKAFFLLRKGKYHLIHTHEEAAFMGALFRWLFRLPHLYDMHSDLSQQMSNFQFSKSRLLARLVGRAEKWVLKQSDFVIGICPALGDTILEMRPTASFAVIENSPLPYDPDNISPQLEEQVSTMLGSEDIPLIMYTGTLEVYQGIDLLMDAAREVAAHNRMVRFVLVGGNPKQVAVLRSMLEMEHLADYFVIIQQRPTAEIPAFLKQATILISPRARGTNTPLKIYSYLASGKPILATDLLTHTQVLNSEIACLVAPDGRALGQGIVDLLADPSRCENLAAAALKVYQDQFCYEKYLDKVSLAIETTMEVWEKQQEISEKDHYSRRLYSQKDFAQNFDGERFGSFFGKMLSKMELETFQSIVAQDGSTTILDAGGGTGRLALALANQDVTVTVLDTSLEMMSIAREKANITDQSIDLICGTIDNLPFQNQTYEWVVSSRVIMHVTEWQTAIREFCRVASKGLIFDFPPLTAFPALAVPILLFKKIIDPTTTQNYHVIHVPKVIKELQLQGFRVVKLDRRFFMPVGFHRKINKPALSLFLERVFKAVGLTALLGAPVTIWALRDGKESDH